MDSITKVTNCASGIDVAADQNNETASNSTSVKPDMQVIVHNSVPVVTTEMLADFYGTETNNIKVNVTRNSDRFEEGKHFFKLEGEKLKQFKNRVTESNLVQKQAKALTLWTERGAARHAKMLETDKAWEVFEQLEECYFNKKSTPIVSLPNFADPVAAARAWADEVEQNRIAKQEVIALQNKVEEAKPMVEAFDKIAIADGSFNMTESAKVLQVKPITLRKHLHAHRWIYRRNGSKNWLGYQDRIQSGLIEHKINVYEKEDGSQGVSEQVRITPKGITKLAMELSSGGAV